MIRVTRLDRAELAINCDWIESIEARPDTTIRLVNGQSLVVRESIDELMERIARWRAEILERAGLAGLLGGGPRPTTEELAEDMIELFDEIGELTRREPHP